MFNIVTTLIQNQSLRLTCCLVLKLFMRKGMALMEYPTVILLASTNGHQWLAEEERRLLYQIMSCDGSLLTAGKNYKESVQIQSLLVLISPW